MFFFGVEAIDDRSETTHVGTRISIGTTRIPKEDRNDPKPTFQNTEKCNKSKIDGVGGEKELDARSWNFNTRSV